MTKGRVVWIVGLVLAFAVAANAADVKIGIRGEIVAPSGTTALDGTYPVVLRLWEGRGLRDAVLWMDTTEIHVLNGRFELVAGPYPPLTRSFFSTDRTVSFQFEGEPELRKRTVFNRMTPSGRVICAPITLTTANIPATAAGTRVRILQGNDNPASIGILLSLSPERVEFLQGSVRGTSTWMAAKATRLPMDSISRFEISARHRQWGDVGLVSGLIIGAVVGNAMGANEEDDLTWSKETKRAFDAFAGAVLGSLAGYIFGSSISTDRWQEIPLDRLKERARGEEGPIVQTPPNRN